MATSKRKILFIAESVTLAHVARASALAVGLDSEHFEVSLACDPRYNALLGELPFPCREIATIPALRFFRAIANGTPIYDKATLIDYVEADLALIRECRPDAVIGDFRLSLGISARLAGVPYLNIGNAYWSPYAHLCYPVPDIPLARFAGVALAQRLFDLARPAAFALHARPMNQARGHYGLPPLPADLRHVYTEADHVLYADVPELVPTRALPINHHFLGPIPWSPQVALPDWWPDLPDDKPIVYVTLGSSGQATRLPDILRALATLPVTVIAAHAGHPPREAVPDNARLTDFLPGDQAARVADLVICNGGSPTSYQGLAAGIPVIGLASNLDQYLNMSLIDAAGAGILLRSHGASREQIRAAAQRGLDSVSMRAKAGRLGEAVRRLDPAKELANILEDLPGARHGNADRTL